MAEERGLAKGRPVEDLVVELPGQPKVDFKQFAGYVDVDDEAGKSLFYYFAEAEKEADKKPLTLWLNGGIYGIISLLLFFFNFYLHTT